MNVNRCPRTKLGNVVKFLASHLWTTTQAHTHTHTNCNYSLFTSVTGNAPYAFKQTPQEKRKVTKKSHLMWTPVICLWAGKSTYSCKQSSLLFEWRLNGRYYQKRVFKYSYFWRLLFLKLVLFIMLRYKPFIYHLCIWSIYKTKKCKQNKSLGNCA